MSNAEKETALPLQDWLEAEAEVLARFPNPLRQCDSPLRQSPVKTFRRSAQLAQSCRTRDLAHLSLEVRAFCTWACVIELVWRGNVSALLTDIGVCVGFFRHHSQTIRTENGGDSHWS